MNRLVYLSPIVIALAVVACQKREATDAPATSTPAATTSPAPSMSASEPMAPASSASQ